jgi:hypothetical protein
MEFNSFCLSVEDHATRNVITRCNSSMPLYTISLSATPPPQASTYYALTASTLLWHRHLSHLGPDALSKLSTSGSIIYNKPRDIPIGHACQLGRHSRLPFISHHLVPHSALI